MTEITVGVSELRRRLSKYLRDVKAGHTIVITERGRPIGRIIPQNLSLEERMQHLVDAGLVAWSGEKPDLPEPVATNESEYLASDIVVELRKQRF